MTELGGDVAIDDEVVLVGRQGEESVSFEELADLFGSVHTEINLMAGHMNERSVQPFYPAIARVRCSMPLRRELPRSILPRRDPSRAPVARPVP